MKKIIPIILLIALSLSYNSSKAQAFDRSTRIISFGIAGADMFHIPTGYYYYRNGFYSPVTGQFYVEGEFAVHRYVGIGFTTGIGGRFGAAVGPNGVYHGFYPEFNIPIGFITNFHFYQLIGDNVKRNIHQDKLDIYVGLNVGSGIAIHPGGYYAADGTYYPGAVNDALFFLGPQIGLRYFFNDRVGINGELGWGKSFARFGMTFKLGHRARTASAVQ